MYISELISIDNLENTNHEFKLKLETDKEKIEKQAKVLLHMQILQVVIFMSV